MNRISILVLLASGLALSGCSDSVQQPAVVGESPDIEEPNNPPRSTESESSKIVYSDKFPEVLAVKVSPQDGNRFRFDVTLSSAYDSPQRYADAWRVLDLDGNELGVRVLGHDHAGEQPFTRSTAVEIPDGITKVHVEGRDQANGWSGQRFEVELTQP